MTTALPCCNSSRNENINVRTKRITSERIFFSKKRGDKALQYYAFMKIQQFQCYEKTTKKKYLFFELLLSFYAIKMYQHLVKNKELFLKDTFSFWLTMADKPQPTLDLVFSLLQTPFPERISEHSFTAAFTLLDMR